MAAVAHPTRPHVRHNSPLSVAGSMRGRMAEPTLPRPFDLDDSDSDDEPPPAIKFSKVTQALLADAPVASSPPRQGSTRPAARFALPIGLGKRENDTPSRTPNLRVVRRNSPVMTGQRPGSTPPRVVRIHADTSAKRSASISGASGLRYGSTKGPSPAQEAQSDWVTPGPALRQVRVVPRSRANSDTSQDGRTGHVSSTSRSASRVGAANGADSDGERGPAQELSRSTSQPPDPEAGVRLTSLRSTAADGVPPGSQRIKRAPLTGSFLKSGPVRRGLRRRDSEENASPVEEDHPSTHAPHATVNWTPRDRDARGAERSASRSRRSLAREASAEPGVGLDNAGRNGSASNGSNWSSYPAEMAPVQASDVARPRSPSGHRQPESQAPQSRKEVPSMHHQETRADRVDAHAAAATSQRDLSVEPAQYKPPSSSRWPPHRALSLRDRHTRHAEATAPSDALSDQENAPPPTFKRNKDQGFKHLGGDMDIKPRVRLADETPIHVEARQEQRKALGAISANTPHRAAPAPPPKMSILESAAATAAAGQGRSKKKRSHIVINGKIFTQMGRIGKGGSSDVYCVMAENYKTFALKRVKLDDCDESAVRGFKGEIDLLNKLTEVERVVRLFDWELNEDKQELCVLMEKGETDLNRLLTLRLNSEHATFDASFTRHYWREMLECVQAVHDEDIVHSDLKPANFLLVQGRLKLIDFGIANAIDTDNTCNVHRDTHVGTPNYMSPESITDTNAGRDHAGRPVKKDIKVGKASDVWSLGCILYQMTYGRQPFAHIPNQIARIMAITNPNHAIEFPDYGVGDARVPPSLKGVLRRCLNRDPERRPTCGQLLSSKDVYLNPEADDAMMINEELLGQIIAKVVERCRDPNRGIPTPEEVQQYPRSFMEKIRDMVERSR